jgi:hypothetical protein
MEHAISYRSCCNCNACVVHRPRSRSSNWKRMSSSCFLTCKLTTLPSSSLHPVTRSKATEDQEMLRRSSSVSQLVASSTLLPPFNDCIISSAHGKARFECMHAPNQPELSRCSQCDQLGHASPACPLYAGLATRFLFKQPIPFSAMRQMQQQLNARMGYLGSSMAESAPHSSQSHFSC